MVSLAFHFTFKAQGAVVTSAPAAHANRVVHTVQNQDVKASPACHCAIGPNAAVACPAGVDGTVGPSVDVSRADYGAVILDDARGEITQASPACFGCVGPDSAGVSVSHVD